LKAHKTCKVNGQTVLGYHMKKSNEGKSPRKRQMIVSQAEIVDSENEEVVDKEADDNLYQGEENAGNSSNMETEVGSISHETHSQWKNMSLVECITWRQGNALADLRDLMQWQVEVMEQQEELLQEQANSLSQSGCLGDVHGHGYKVC